MKPNNTKYIYDHSRNVYLEITLDELKKYIDQNDLRTAFIFDNETETFTGYPVKIAYQIITNKLSKENFLNKIRNNLIMLK